MIRETFRWTEDYLRAQHHATDEEISRVLELLDFQYHKRASMEVSKAHGLPSIVLDGFLFHGDLGHAANMKMLKELGIKHIVDVCECQLEKAILDNFNVLWINLQDDFQADIKKHFEATNQFLHDCKQKDEKVLVHCAMGISRSSSVVLAYLMKYHHDSLNKAYDYLLERRRVASPNPSFLLQLIRYEKELRASKEIDESKNNDDKANPIDQLDAKPQATGSNTETKHEETEHGVTND